MTDCGVAAFARATDAHMAFGPVSRAGLQAWSNRNELFRCAVTKSAAANYFSRWAESLTRRQKARRRLATDMKRKAKMSKRGERSLEEKDRAYEKHVARLHDMLIDYAHLVWQGTTWVDGTMAYTKSYAQDLKADIDMWLDTWTEEWAKDDHPHAIHARVPTVGAQASFTI